MKPHGALICSRSRDVSGWTMHSCMFVVYMKQNGANLEVLLIAFMLKQGAVIKNNQLKLKHSNMYFKYINCVLMLLVPF
jgi:hypothetical protein